MKWHQPTFLLLDLGSEDESSDFSEGGVVVVVVIKTKRNHTSNHKIRTKNQSP